jgi:sec-independent protein translocase protein TatC
LGRARRLPPLTRLVPRFGFNMPKLLPSDDEARLEQSKMSFGEHLEELRRTLFKSILAILIGFLLGLWLGNDIVSYIQKPLVASLEDFYLRQAVRKQQTRLDELKAHGMPAPASYNMTAEQLAKIGVMPTEYYIVPQDLAALLRHASPQLAAQLPEPKPTAPAESPAASSTPSPEGAPKPSEPAAVAPIISRDQMLPLRLYQPVEEDVRLQLVALNAQEPVMVYLQSALIAGVIFSSPFVFYFIWQFIAAGLYRREQKYVYTYLPLSVGLFIGGSALAFFFAFEPLLNFLLWYYERMHLDPKMRLSEWISLVLFMTLGFGISFQLPLAMVVLERIGIFTVENYWHKWRAAVVVIAILAAILTPSPDPYSMLLMGVPMTFLYFGGIWLCKMMPGTSLNAPHPATKD